MDKDKDMWFLWRFIIANVFCVRTELILLSLTCNPLTVFSSSAQLLNAEQ